MCVLVSLLNKFMLNYTFVGVFYMCMCVCVCPEAISNARPKQATTFMTPASIRDNNFGNFKYSQLLSTHKKNTENN